MARNPLRNTKDKLRLESRDRGVRAEPRSIPRRIYVTCAGRPLHLQRGHHPSMLPDSDGFRIPIMFGRLGNQWNLESSGIKPSLELGTGGSQFQECQRSSALQIRGV